KLQSDPSDWAAFLLTVQYAINTQVHRTTGFTPFSLMHFGRLGNEISYYSITELNLLNPDELQARYDSMYEVVYSAIYERLVQHHAKVDACLTRSVNVKYDPFTVGCFVMTKSDVRSSKQEPR
ncbi:hypothetical protein BC829DRAFT_452479, partial [Chytridium lagenaria]